MYTAKSSNNHRRAFTLIELIVVIGIILVIAALAAAFAPRVSDSQNLTRAIDQFEQWLLTAKMRAKRDGLATGIRFIPAPNDLNPANPNLANSGTYSTFQYIQQPDPLAGSPGGGTLMGAGGTLGPGIVQFANVDFTLQGLPPGQWLVQQGDYLEVRDGGVYRIGTATGQMTLQLLGPSGTLTPYEQNLSITTPTTNYRILRQPRILIGEAPLLMPGSLAVDMNPIIAGNPLTASNVQAGPSGYLEILFAPSGAVVGSNAGNGKVMIYIHDVLQVPVDPNRAGIVAVQTRNGFIGAYSVAAGADPFFYAEEGRESGL